MSGSEEKLLEILRGLDPRRELPRIVRTRLGYVRIVWSDGTERWGTDTLRYHVQSLIQTTKRVGRIVHKLTRAERDAIVAALEAWLRENAP